MEATKRIRELEKELASTQEKLRDTKSMMDSLVQNVVSGIMRIHFDGVSAKVIYLSDSVFRLLEYTKEEYQKLQEADDPCGFCFFRQYRDAMMQGAREAVQGAPIAPLECCLTRKDGSKVWIDLRGEVISRTDQDILIQYILIDTTKTHNTLEQIKKEKKKLDIIAKISADLLFEYDIRQDIMYYTVQGRVKLDSEQIAPDYFKTIPAQIHPEDADALKDFCDQMRGGKQHVHTQLRKRFLDRKYHWVEVDGRTIYEADGTADRVIGKICNIDERMEKEESLKRSSERDSLTGLYNHMPCKEKIQRQLKQIKPGDRYYLMICDIDNFKKINDNNGHLFGDAVICTFADELRSLFPSAIKGRIGGDEFLFMVKNMVRELLEEKLFQLNERFSKLNADDGEVIKISCSIGVAVCTYEEHDYEKAFRYADYTLYKVKDGNKGTFQTAMVGDGSIEQHQSYLESKGEEKDYIQKDSLIHSDEELVLFSLELFDNVKDSRSGLKMMSDRVCRYFGFDDIVFIKKRKEAYEKLYHWGNASGFPFESQIMEEDADGWKYVESKFDERGVAILTRKELEKIPGRVVGSLLLVRYEESDGSSGIVIFIDRITVRNWEGESGTLLRISSIICNRMFQIQSEEKNKEEIDYRINYDGLTELPSYSKFLSLCGQYIQERRFRKDVEYCFIYTDFANFQYLNEVYGYNEGDMVLKSFAANLRTKCPYGVYFTRITSDHFAGFLEVPKDTEPAAAVRRFLSAFCAEKNKEYSLCNLIVICGICKMDGDTVSLSAMIDCANTARKYGKKRAETSCIVYNEQIRERNESEKTIVANMTSALENNEFQVYLQPKVSLQDERCVGAEALVRWVKPDGSMIYPDQFIPLFEQNGFITRVDFHILEQVLKYLREVLDRGEAVVPVSVNFSRLHNDDAHFVQKIKELLDGYGIAPGLLEAEVTESIYMYDLNILRENIRRLQQMGVKISIDDFGSGYSSLNVLSKVSADVIKLDKQFLDDYDEDSSPEFIKYLITMIKHLGYQIIAEGVETKRQAEMLKAAECDMAQGYYYARPMPVSEFNKFLQKQNTGAVQE